METTIADRKPPNKLTRVELHFGTGSKAKRHYNKFVELMPSVKHTLEKLGRKDHADLLRSWQRTSGYRIAEAPHWTCELDADEWQALSRGLRHQGTEGRSMYEWLQRFYSRFYDTRPWRDSGHGSWGDHS